MDQPYRFLVMGPQGSGKGTQATLLADKLRIPHLSMGQLLREEIAQDTALGKKIKPILKVGNLVSYQDAAEVLASRIQKPDMQNGFILDGYPRNMKQYSVSDFLKPNCVLVIDIPEEISIARISGRLICSQCGEVYNTNQGAKAGDRCRECGEELIQRDDDKPAAIKHRLELYHQETEPVIAKYDQQGIVCRVDGTGTIEEVHNKISKCLTETCDCKISI